MVAIPGEVSLPTIIVRGLDRVLELNNLLERAAELAGQSGRMHWLDCFFTRLRVSKWRQPCLVLATEASASKVASELTPAEVCGAVLFTEYHIFGFRTGVLVSPDQLGMRNMFAASGCDTQVVSIAMRALIRKGALFVVSSYEVTSINARCINPIPLNEFQLRWHRAATHPDGFLVGLRTGEGEWLSFIGGWRNGSTTVLHWQVNSAAHPADSLSLVMRSYFIESEIALGARSLVIDGSTHTNIVDFFTRVPVVDLVARKRTKLALRYRTMSVLFRMLEVLLKRKYMSVGIANDPNIRWHYGGQQSASDCPRRAG